MTLPLHRTIKQTTLALGACTAIALASPSLSSPAFAMDPVSFFRAIQAEVEKDGNTMTFESLDSVGSDGARAIGVEIIDETEGNRVTIAEMFLSGTAVNGDDSFSFEKMDASNFRFINARDERTSTLTIGQVSAEGFEVLKAEERSNPFWPLNIVSGRFERVQVVGTGMGNFSWNVPTVTIGELKHGDGKSFSLESFLLAGSTGSFADDKGASGSFTLGEISIEDADRIGESGFRIGDAQVGAMSLTGTDEKNRAIAFTFSGMSSNNIYSPDYSSIEPANFPEEPAFASFGSMALSFDGNEVFSMAGGESTARFEAATQMYSAVAKMNDLTFNIDVLPPEPSNAKFQAQMKELGYDRVQMDIAMDGGWNIGSGLLSLDTYKFDIEDMGALDISLKLGGYTVELAQKIQEVSAKMNAASDNEMQQALSMQILALLSGLSVEEIGIRVDDDSLTRRIMDMQAKASGQSAEDMAGALPFMAGAMLSQLEIPEFAASVSSAVSAFLQSALDNKGSIVVKANPDEPVSFAEIMGIGAGVQAGNVKPQEVIDRFNLTISGN